MDIKDSHTLTKAIEDIALFCVGWALTDKVGDIRRMAQARFRSLMYKEFDIPKRSGGTRRITAPTGKLKDIQRCISAIVAPYYRTPECVHGFAEGRSVATNARNHTGRNYVLNIDLKAFPTITYTRVLKSLQKLGFNEDVSDIISRLCTIPMWDEQKQMFRNALPQGSPALQYSMHLFRSKAVCPCSNIWGDLLPLCRRHNIQQ